MILYHYTGQTGLQGILKEKCVWATNIFYLNDQQELLYAKDLLHKTINYSIGASKPGLLELAGKGLSTSNLVLEIIDGMLNPNLMNIYVFALSEDGDLLSQWRAYSKNGIGFSIGFDKKRFEKITSKRNFKIDKCIYETQDQLNLLDELYAKYKPKLEPDIETFKSDEGKKNLVKLVKQFSSEFLERAIFIKHRLFYEEKEWRLVAYPIKSNYGEVFVKEGLSYLVPFIKVPLSDDVEEIPISEIIVGPTPDPDLSVSSAELFLRSIKINNVKVKKSNIPYRQV